MDSDFILNIKDISVNIVVIAFVVFILTMIIKWPIKRVTAKLDENKRKAVNTVIVFIPMVLSMILSILYFGIFNKIWFSMESFEVAISTYLVAVTIYAIFSRLVIVFKGMKNSSHENVISKESISFFKQTIKTISKALKIDEKKLDSVLTEINKIMSLKSEIESNAKLQNIAQIEQLDNTLSELESEKTEILNNISYREKQLCNYQKLLHEGE